MGSDVVVGIDGGGSKTLALLADAQGRIVGRGMAGPSNYQAVGAEQAWQALEAALQAALADAQILRQEVRAVCLGLAGVDRPADLALVHEWASRQWAGLPVMIVNDAQLVLAAGTPAGCGVALISGTGSIAYGARPDGQSARAGGWGHLLGDEGSGYAIGLAALRAVVRAADGRGPATRLHGAVLEQWGLGAPESLIQRMYVDGIAAVEIATLTPVVVRSAAEGDGVAQAIIDDGCMELALAAVSVVRQLDLTSPVPCALAGGVLVHLPVMATGLRVAAQQLGVLFEPVMSVTEPAMGAVKLAIRQLEQQGAH
ncbi:MAG: BadF/BadG/BcrA/BcrD type ATPase [Herpetosiphonaceae bacterium]|nr:BadF/BadG/BcrA/BcrD type ATPase [Herpetosiphonaceae bacterium]